MTSLFKALADPTRREILRLLSRGELTAGQIAEKFAMSWPSVSHHLGVLKNAGLVEVEKKGQYLYYSLNATVLQELIAYLFELLNVKEDEKNDVFIL